MMIGVATRSTSQKLLLLRRRTVAIAQQQQQQLQTLSSSVSSLSVSPFLVRCCYLSTQTSPAAEESSSSEQQSQNNGHFLLILGKPGGGKGTISKKVLKDFPKFHHVSTGDLLRQHVRDETSLGKEAKSYMDHGKLVPDELMIDLVVSDATPYLQKGHSLLLDGFPRTIDQAKALDETVNVDLVINLNIPTETIVERIADRWIHPGSDRIYSYSYKPPKIKGKDDITGEPLIQRNDDKPDVVRKRLQSYDNVTAPLVTYYKQKGVLQTFTGTMSDIIYPDVKNWLQTKVPETAASAAATEE